MEVFFLFILTSHKFYVNILGQNPIALLAQLDRVSGYGPEGQGFESLTARHKKTRSHESVTLFFLYETFYFLYSAKKNKGISLFLVFPSYDTGSSVCLNIKPFSDATLR